MTATSDLLARADEKRIFQRGPLGRVLAILPVGREPLRGSRRQAVIVALIAWIPLAVGTIVQDGFRFGASASAFLTDFGAHARYLVALPLLVVADRFCGSRLTALAHYFLDSGMVEAKDRAHFDALVDATRQRCESVGAAVMIVAATYAIVTLLLAVIPASEFPTWHRAGESRRMSLAGGWQVAVSAPLLIALFLAWMWRLGVWTGFLCRMARSPLRLCAAHPDRAGGLKFVGFSVRAYAPIGAALGALVAGRVANQVWHGTPLGSYDITAGGLVVGVVVLFTAPLFSFTPRLMHEWREGVYKYGRLAEQVGLQFEDKWFRSHAVDRDALEASDFSAAVDLSGYVSNVYDMRVVPGELKSMLALAGATALPLLPVVVLAMPFDVLAKSVASLFF